MANKPVSDGEGEFFYLDENGKKQDADLHADMLDVDEATEKYVRNMGKQIARDLGISEESLKLMYGDD